jgi:putative ABC transport system substrate-binding protein
MCRKLIGIAFAALLFVCGSTNAQQSSVPRIGYLTLRSSPSEQDQLFKQALADVGWIDGQNCILEWRGASGKVENISAAAAELIRIKPNVIVASSTPVVEGVRNTATTIPIVMSGVADPVGIGFVKSLARPGGNITGLSIQSPELAGKRLELLRDIAPKLSRVAFLAYAPDPAHRLFISEAQDAAIRMNLQMLPVVVKTTDEIDNALLGAIRERAGALIVQPLFIGGLRQTKKILDFTTKNRLPTVSDGTQFADVGGLIYYGPSRLELHRRTASFVDKILKGAKPADLPVEQPTTFELVINLKTAKQIVVTIPPHVLARADRVIK